MASLSFSTQFILAAFFLLIRFILRKRTSILSIISERCPLDFEDVFAVLNIFGLFTTDLVHMSRYHVFELTVLGGLFVSDLLNSDSTTDPWGIAHHILSLVGISIQLHFGLGGGLMAFLLLDEWTTYVSDPRLHFAVFFAVRVVGYNAVILVAVRQGLAAPPSPALALWIWVVVLWGAFAFVYHGAWLWRERCVVAAVYRAWRGEGAQKALYPTVQ
jgi:hypothetical protein